MYLSRIKLDTRKRATIIALSNPQQFHGAIETALGVDNERSRTLWRLDTLDGEPCLLILTKDIPTLSTVAEQFSCNSDMVETKKYDALLDRIVQGSQWRFRLTANPTKGQRKKDRKTGEKSPERGKVAALISVPQQEEWLLKRAEEYGFSLSPDAFGVTHSHTYVFHKQGRQRVTILSVSFEGVLTVLDAERFRQTMTEGIGRGKAYGNGLLTIVRM